MKDSSSRLVVEIVAALAIANYGCSAPEPGTLTYCDNERADTPAATGAYDAGAPWPAGGRADGGAGSGGGATGGTAPDSGGATSEAFLGSQAAFASKPIPVSAREKHQAAGAVAQQPGLNCQTCHVPGGASSVPFLAAGFVATQVGGSNGAADVEVRVWSSAAKAGASNHTDADGYFWIKPPATPISGPFRVGVRDATRTKLMPGEAPGGACSGSSCHGGGVGPIFLK